MLLAYLLAMTTAPAQCAPVEVTVQRADVPASFDSGRVKQVSANFAAAYAKACAEGLMKKEPLVTVTGANATRLFLFNAPEANIVSIYPREDRMVLEYYFVTPDGAANVPGVEELHEAIFCAQVGATEAEQEESGRCLPD